MSSAHSGHRDRLRERARADLENFQPHEILELLLFYAIPRRNVNQDAHRLIDRFGSVAGALQAPEAALSSVAGVGSKSADWLRAMGALVEAYRALECWERPMLGNVRLARQFLERHFPELPEEGVWLVSLTAEGRLLLARPFAPRGKWTEPEFLPAAMDLPMRLHAHSVLVLQFSAKGCQPSEYDLRATRRLAETLEPLRVFLLDHLICDGETFYSMFARGDLPARTHAPRENPLREHYLD